MVVVVPVAPVPLVVPAAQLTAAASAHAATTRADRLLQCLLMAKSPCRRGCPRCRRAKQQNVLRVDVLIALAVVVADLERPRLRRA
jgi:hypothetical protein